MAKKSGCFHANSGYKKASGQSGNPKQGPISQPSMKDKNMPPAERTRLKNYRGMGPSSSGGTGCSWG